MNLKQLVISVKNSANTFDLVLSGTQASEITNLKAIIDFIFSNIDNKPDKIQSINCEVSMVSDEDKFSMESNLKFSSSTTECIAYSFREWINKVLEELKL